MPSAGLYRNTVCTISVQVSIHNDTPKTTGIVLHFISIGNTTNFIIERITIKQLFTFIFTLQQLMKQSMNKYRLATRSTFYCIFLHVRHFRIASNL